MQRPIAQDNSTISEEQLKINQEVIDLIAPLMDDEDHDDYYIDAKRLVKYLWNNGYKVVKR